MEVISQRQLRNDSGEILRRAAAGEVFRIRAGDTTVELRRSAPTAVERLRAAGRLRGGGRDDFADFPEPQPLPDGQTLDELMDEIRGDR